MVTKEMRELLERLADLAAQASDEVYDDDDADGTAGILNMCDQLVEKIDMYFKKNTDTPAEVLIVQTLKENTENGFDFITPNEGDLYGRDPKELSKAFNYLVEVGILKKRECDGVAYEWADKNMLYESLQRIKQQKKKKYPKPEIIEDQIDKTVV